MGPRRPLPKSVYARRRIAVLVVVVAVIGLLAWAFWPKGGSAAATGPGAGPEASSASGLESSDAPTAVGPGDSATSASGDACDPSKIAITANTDKTQYQSGEQVQMSLTLTNNSSKDCVIAAGTDQQVFTITSPSATGDDVYWTSTDCQTDETPQNVVLKAGVPISTPPITWDRHRSQLGDCDPASIAARPIIGSGGASFDLTVKLGDLTSAKHRFYLY